MRHLQIGDVTSTIERDGRWVPIFPNAKYVFHKREYVAWEQAAKEGKQPPGNVWKYNCEPIVEAGQALLADDDYTLDDTVWLTHDAVPLLREHRVGRPTRRSDRRPDAPRVAMPRAVLVHDFRLGRQGSGKITPDISGGYRRDRNLRFADLLSKPGGRTCRGKGDTFDYKFVR